MFGHLKKAKARTNTNPNSYDTRQEWNLSHTGGRLVLLHWCWIQTSKLFSKHYYDEETHIWARKISLTVKYWSHPGTEGGTKNTTKRLMKANNLLWRERQIAMKLNLIMLRRGCPRILTIINQHYPIPATGTWQQTTLIWIIKTHHLLSSSEFVCEAVIMIIHEYCDTTLRFKQISALIIILQK